MENSEQKILMKNNIIIKAKYNIATIENRIFQLILYKMQKNNDDTLKCKISLEEFKQIIKRRNDATIKAISIALEELRQSSIEIKTEDRWLKYGFINGFTYYKKANFFEINATKEVYELLFSYLKGYTPINLAIFFSLKNSYAQRFYEFLRLWSNSKNIINYPIDELKELLNLENQYNLYADFKRRIINPSIKELNEKSLMQIDVKENKSNRKVVSIDFIVTDNDKRKYFEGNNEIKSIHQEQQKKKTYSKDKSNELKFNNFDQRNYDYDKLEKELLGWNED